MKTTILLRIETELKEKLKKVSELERRSVTSQINKILSDYCESYKGEVKNG
jgi:hypothetical protein